MCIWAVWYQTPCWDHRTVAPTISCKVSFVGLEKSVNFFESLQIEYKNVYTAGFLGRSEIM